MNDSLTLDRSARTRHPRSKSANLPAFDTTTRGGVVTRPAKVVPLRDHRVEHAQSSDPSSIIIERLGIGAPTLLVSADQATRTRLAQHVIKRLGSMIHNATSAFCLQVGEVAATIGAAQAMALQDAALTIKPRSEDLIAKVACALSPAQLLAILAAVSHDHDPTGIDALRCRHLVTGDADAMAREAMLDLTSAAEPAGIVDRVVATHMVHLFESVGLLCAETLDALADLGQNDRPEPTVRRPNDPLTPHPLLRALATGEHETAITLLASAAGVSVETVRAAIFLRSSKGLLSLGWRAGLDAADAARLQDSLGRLPPNETLRPTDDGSFPLTGPEMLWQCRFLSRSQHAFADR